jgi:16S rRNA processing protein RimM
MTRNKNRLTQEVEKDLVLIGEIVKPHGVRGEVKAYLYSEQPGNIKEYDAVVLQSKPDARTETFDIIRSREQGKTAILQLDGIVSREHAESLQGFRVLVYKEDFPALETGEYYWHQLEGLLVITETGKELGRVARLFNNGAQDVMVVAGSGNEFMIPLKGDIVREIDTQAGKVVVSPPQGLLEINS